MCNCDICCSLSCVFVIYIWCSVCVWYALWISVWCMVHIMCLWYVACGMYYIVYMVCIHVYVPRDGERCRQVVRHWSGLSQVDGGESWWRVNQLVSFRTDFSSQKENIHGEWKTKIRCAPPHIKHAKHHKHTMHIPYTTPYITLHTTYHILRPIHT